MRKSWKPCWLLSRLCGVEATLFAHLSNGVWTDVECSQKSLGLVCEAPQPLLYPLVTPPHFRELAPRHYLRLLVSASIVAPVDEDSLGSSMCLGFSDEAGQAIEAREEISRNCCAAFCFNQEERARCVHHQIYFGPSRLAVVREVSYLPRVGSCLVDLAGDPGFKDRSSQGVCAQLLGVANAEQEAQEAGVQKMQFGRFHRLFSHVPMPRRKPMAQEAGFQNRQPGSRSGLRNASVSSKGAQHQLLRGSSRAQAKESCECLQARHIEQLPNISLNVGGGVVRIPTRRVDATIKNSRISARPQRCHEIERCCAKAPDFVQAKRKQLKHGRSPCQGLSNLLTQPKVLRACEDETTRRSVRIDVHLEVGQKLWDVLNFIHDSAVRVARQESAWVSAHFFAGVEWLQIHIRVVRKQRAAESRLAGLPRAGDRQDGVLSGQFSERSGCISLNHFNRIEAKSRNESYIFIS